MNIIGGETMFNATITRIGVAIQSALGAATRDEKGATAVEYGLIVGLIAVVIIGAVTALGGTLNGWFESINGELAG
jgi:pilus assembly protein Flp/PilA